MKELHDSMRESRRFEVRTTLVVLFVLALVLGYVESLRRDLTSKTRDRITRQQTRLAIEQLVERNGLRPPDLMFEQTPRIGEGLDVEDVLKMPEDGGG